MSNESDNLVKKKVCMLGAFAVGKTSLVRRYVENMFSEKYQTTIGVKIDKKVLEIEGRKTVLVIWDLAGKDDIVDLRTSYLRGASGYFLVVDKTRTNTLQVAQDVQRAAQETLGNIPFIAVMNKWDLEGKWDMDEETIIDLRIKGWDVIKTSAKNNTGVEEAFMALGRKMIIPGK
ncbi:MAG: Rab family GTPase [Dehalococcoidales bacterium]|jgi:small GTP-binding protein|nr:GTP-binding protein [Dehalococcoidales bacterium]MDD4794294.1 GTP-binding protein [Dehalococcoidales bacterium]MDD5498547.1 GTP-binding protein [Dehalococcoidales bacterium]MDX9803703.1 Rab family GTPase [Dehalococcoidales bacterium]